MNWLVSGVQIALVTLVLTVIGRGKGESGRIAYRLFTHRDPFVPLLGIGKGKRGGKVRTEATGHIGVVSVVRDGGDVRDVS